MKSIYNSLYWRISALFLLLLIVVGAAYIYITVQTAEQYFRDKHQRLNASIAEQMIKEVPPFINGEVNKSAMDKIMHSMMAINPAIEIYVLDPEGKILSYVAPYKKVKLTQVNLKPVFEFIDTRGEISIEGDDPRNPGEQKIFSAAPVLENEELVGYVYIVLASEEYVSVSEYLFGNFLLNLGGRNLIFTLIASLIIGLLGIWLITQNLRKIIATVREFQNGNLLARIPVKSKGELAQLSHTFNEMADTMLEDIKKREAVENLRKELVANVSHDLRTPLAVVRGYIETVMIKKDSLSEEDKDHYMNTALDSIDRLEKLVNELFELSKLETQQIQPQKEPFPISELIQDVVYKYQILAEEKGITLRPHLSKDLSIVHADIALMERVLQNLIGNAIKFTPKGGEVTVGISKSDKHVTIQVIDTGIGIPESEIPYVFDRYHKVNRTGGNITGSGLGLAIVKKILEIHHTSISLTSKVNEGTTFSFDLPLYT